MKCQGCDHEGDDFWELRSEAEPPTKPVYRREPKQRQLCYHWIERGRGTAGFEATEVRLRVCPECGLMRVCPNMPGVLP